MEIFAAFIVVIPLWFILWELGNIVKELHRRNCIAAEEFDRRRN